MTLAPCPCSMCSPPVDIELAEAIKTFIEKQKDCPPEFEQILAEGLPDLHADSAPRGKE